MEGRRFDFIHENTYEISDEMRGAINWKIHKDNDLYNDLLLDWSKGDRAGTGGIWSSPSSIDSRNHPKSVQICIGFGEYRF